MIPTARRPAASRASRSATWSRACPGAEVYPPGVESRDAYVALQTEFAPGETTPIVILADVDRRSPTDVATITAAHRRTRPSSLALDGIDRVEGPFAISDPATGLPLSPGAGRGALRRCPTASGRPASTPLLAQYVRGNTIQLDGDQPARRRRRRQATDLIPVVRAVDAGRRHHDPGRRRGRERPRLPRLAGGAGAVRGRADPVRQRLHPVPAVRLGRSCRSRP